MVEELSKMQPEDSEAKVANLAQSYLELCRVRSRLGYPVSSLLSASIAIDSCISTPV